MRMLGRALLVYLFAVGVSCDGAKPGVEASGVGRPKVGPPPPSAVAPAPALANSALAALLPGEADGYRPDGADGHYGPNTLFDLINGGAEVFLALNFRAAVNRRYAKQDGPDLIVDIFDMGSSSDAYGAYHHDMREGKSAGVGRESEHGGSSLFFWKDRYYVSVVAMADNEKSHASVSAVARAIADRIDGDGAPPAIVGWLPEDGLQGEQVHYFHTWPLLNRHYHFADDDLLELGRDTEGVFARYRGPGADAVALVLIRYPSSERAQRARARFAKGFLSGASEEVVESPKGWAGLRQREEHVIGVFGAKSKEGVEVLFSAVERRRRGER